MNASAFGSLVGGILAVFLLSALLDWAVFKRVVDTPRVGTTLSVVAAVVFGFILYGFGNADGGPWNPLPGGLSYVFGGSIVLALRLWYLSKQERPDREAASRRTSRS